MEQGTAKTSGIGELFTECTEHLTEKHSHFLRRWLSAVDWDAADNKRKERLSWNPHKNASKAAGVLSMTGLIFEVPLKLELVVLKTCITGGTRE